MKTVVVLVDSCLMCVDTFKDVETAKYYLQNQYKKKEWFESELSLCFAMVDENCSIVEYLDDIDLYD